MKAEREQESNKMQVTPNPFISGIIGILAGDLLGSAVNRFSKVLLEHINLGGVFGHQGPSINIIDRAVGATFQVGLLSVGAELITSAIPWIASEPSAYSMFMLGLLMTNENLRTNMDFINRSFWLPSVPPSVILAPAADAAAAAAASTSS
jgi:hypothetical protein